MHPLFKEDNNLLFSYNSIRHIITTIMLLGLLYTKMFVFGITIIHMNDTFQMLINLLFCIKGILHHVPQIFSCDNIKKTAEVYQYIVEVYCRYSLTAHALCSQALSSMKMRHDAGK